MFTEVRTDYVDDKGVIHIDGYKTLDENEEGVGIAYFIHGEVYWRDTEYQFDPLVETIVEELKKNQRKFVLDNVDYPLLGEQKETLLTIINNYKGDSKEANALIGVAHLLDEIQDYAVNVLGKDVKEVFNSKD